MKTNWVGMIHLIVGIKGNPIHSTSPISVQGLFTLRIRVRHMTQPLH